MLLGLGKTPVKKQTYKQLTKTVDRLTTKQAAGPLNTKQESRLAKATPLLAAKQAKRDGPPPRAVAPFPTDAPPAGHRWIYNAATNSYVPEPIPLDTGTAGGTTGGGTTGGGGGGGTPDFTGYTSGVDPYGQTGTFTPGDGATPSAVNPLDAALASTTTMAGFSKVGAVVIVGLAVGAIVMSKKRGRAAKG